MAIYRLEKKSISRGSNHNLVAAVAYRAGAKFTDTNKLNPKATTHDYTKKTDIAHSEIILPDELAEQLTQAGINLNLEQVANLVEQGETTKRGKMKTSAKLASEYVLAGSHELSQTENIQAFQEFAKQQAEEQGVIAMVFVHDPKHGEDMSAGTQAADSSKKKDLRNIHAHVVVLSRQLALSGDKLELGDKSNSELSDTDRKKKGLEPSRQWLKGVREQWANIQNQSLERHNLAPVTHKSYKDLGVKFRPTKHLGKDATAMERKGLQTHLGQYNESINQYNRVNFKSAAERFTGLTEQKINESERSAEWANKAAEWTAAESGWAAGSIRDLERRVRDSKQYIEDGKRDVTWANRGTERFREIINSTEQQTASTVEQERQVNSLIAERTGKRSSTRPNPFDDAARRARIDRIIEQEGRFDRRTEQFDRDIARNRSADARTAQVARRLKLNMAMILLNRHHENSALQHWETTEDSLDKFDTRQLHLLDNFAQKIGADSKTSDFINDSRRVAEIFTADLIEQNTEIFKLLRNPSKEREEHNKLLPKNSVYTPQNDLKEFTRDYVDNEPTSLNRASESTSVSLKRHRRS